MTAHPHLTDEHLTIAQVMVDALRTIASGKGDYGKDLKPYEHEDIARSALRKIGCL